MNILYKKIDNKLNYWKYWEKDSKTGYIHWGEIGTKGQYKEVKSGIFNNQKNKIEKERERKLNEGYSEFDENKLEFLEIEYLINGLGTMEELDKRHRLENEMDQILSWNGLGGSNGGSIGSGTMEVGCFVVDYEIAKKVIEENLKNTEFENYSRIFRMNEK